MPLSLIVSAYKGGGSTDKAKMFRKQNGSAGQDTQLARY